MWRKGTAAEKVWRHAGTFAPPYQLPNATAAAELTAVHRGLALLPCTHPATTGPGTGPAAPWCCTHWSEAHAPAPLPATPPAAGPE